MKNEIDKESIVTALKTIKQVCMRNVTDDYGSCAKTCPFGYGEGTCCINDLIPSNWKINTEESMWKALL